VSNKIFIGNLDFGITDQELRELLSEVGEVVDVHLPTDRETGRPRGFAFVRFATEEQAAQAVETMSGREVSGRTLRLDIAEDRPRPTRPRRDFGSPRPGSFNKSGKPKGSRRGLRAKKRS
jgi:RNA recognition motif-containing protein